MKIPGGPKVSSDLLRMAQQIFQRFLLIRRNPGRPAGTIFLMRQSVNAVTLNCVIQRLKVR